MRLGNTERRYGGVAIALHWLVAVLIVGLLAAGLYMVRLPDVGFDQRKIALILLHKQLGMVVLGFALLRLAWRQVNPLPRLADNVPEWQQVAAAFVHLCFYALMLAQPISGWLMSSAAGIRVVLFGLLPLPDLVAYDDDLFQRLRTLHHWLGYALAALLCGHVLAALRHHFLLGDDTLRKMLGRPGR